MPFRICSSLTPKKTNLMLQMLIVVFYTLDPSYRSLMEEREWHDRKYSVQSTFSVETLKPYPQNFERRTSIMQHEMYFISKVETQTESRKIQTKMANSTFHMEFVIFI